MNQINEKNLRLTHKKTTNKTVKYLGIETKTTTHEFVGTLRLIESNNPTHKRFKLISGDFRDGSGVEYSDDACKRAMSVVGLDVDQFDHDEQRVALCINTTATTRPQTVIANTLSDARNAWIQHRSGENDLFEHLGGSDMKHGCGDITVDGQLVANISFNGRVWDNNGDEIKLVA